MEPFLRQREPGLVRPRRTELFAEFGDVEDWFDGFTGAERLDRFVGIEERESIVDERLCVHATGLEQTMGALKILIRRTVGTLDVDLGADERGVRH